MIQKVGEPRSMISGWDPEHERFVIKLVDANEVVLIETYAQRGELEAGERRAWQLWLTRTQH